MHLDFNIPLPHILLPLALSFVTFQQIAFLVDCYKHTKSLESQIPLESYRESQSKKSQTLDSPNIRESQHSQSTLDSKTNLDVQSLDSQSSLESSSMESKGSTTQNPKNTQIQERDSTHSLTHINFLDYCLFITFFPQLIAGPIVHHGEMMPQFARLKAYKQCKKHKKHKKDNEHTESHTTLSHTLSQSKESKSPQCQETQTLLTSENVITTAHSNTTDTRMYEVSQAQETYRESQSSQYSLESQTLDSQNPQTLDSKATSDSKTTLDSQHSQSTLDSKTNLDAQSLNSLNSQTRLESKETLVSQNISESQYSQYSLESQTLDSQNSQSSKSQYSQNLDSKTNLDLQSLESKANLDSQYFQYSLESQLPLESYRESQKHNRDSKESLNSLNSQSTLESKETLDSHTNNKSHIHLANRAFIHWELVAKGLFIFSLGLFKKVFIADSFAKWANAGYSVVEKGGSLNIFESWITSLSYTFQLYFDFSGYCDMAIGLGLLFGIMLPINFNSPYKALNIADFWRRWHITLGRFLKEYLYIPLGGNRNDKRNPSLAQSLHTHNSPHLSMSDSSCLTHHSYANKTPNSYTLDNGMNIGDSNHRDSHTTESHLIQSQAKRDSKDSQTILESQRDSKEKEEVTQRVSQTNMESYVSQTIKQSVDSQNTQYNVSRHSEGARATEESTQSESIKKESTQKDSKQSESIKSNESKNNESKSNESIGSESKQREYKNVLESQINTESIDSHTSFISQSHFDSQTILESQDSLNIENNTESFNSHNNVESTDSQSHFNSHNVFNPEAKKEPLESTQKDSHNTIQSVESKNRNSHTTDSQTHKESQTNTESKVSHTSLHNTLFNKLLTLRNLFIVAFLSGIWHGAGWGFVIWGIMHGIAMCVHRIYMWWVKELEKKCSLVGENDCLHYAHISKASSHSTDVARDLVDLKVAITNEATPTRYPAKNSANTTITHICISKSNNTQSTPNQVQDSQVDSQSKTITQSTTQNRSDAQSHTDSQPNKIHNPYSFARFYTALRHTRLYTLLCWFLTFNFVNIAWIFFRAENIQGACNLLKGMFGGTYIALPNFLENTLAFLKTRGVVFEKWLENVQADFMVLLWIFGVLLLCLWFRNSVEMLRCFTPKIRNLAFGTLLFYAALFMLGEHAATEFLYFNF